MKTMLPALLVLWALPQETDPARAYRERIHPLMQRYCLGCHSTKDAKGELDLERFATFEDLRKDPRPWSAVLENLENGEMPPKKKAQPSGEERKTLIAWTRAFLDAEARARAGDPGRVVVRRLTNSHYDRTIRDLTGVDLSPARDFPADGAAGEGFTSTGDALVTSPALVGKYLSAAKEVASHLVLLPDGFRFSPSRTARDWTDEAVAALRRIYAPYGKDGALPLEPYLRATLRHRDGFDVARVAADERLNPKYLRTLWEALNGAEPSFPLDLLRARWKTATEKDVAALVGLIDAWRAPLWRHQSIGSYGSGWKLQKTGSFADGHLARAVAVDPPFVAAQTLRAQPAVVPGEDEVVLRLSALGLPDAGEVAWTNPRFEGPTARSLADIGRFEIDLRACFEQTTRVLAALDGGPPDGLDPAWLGRWRQLLGDSRVMAPAVPVERLDTPVPPDPRHPGLRGWRAASGDLPVVLGNGWNAEHRIPGRASPHRVVVHPLPDRFVAVEWSGNAAGRVLVQARIEHVHGGCGNSVAWWIEQRRGDLAARLDGGALNQAGTAVVQPREVDLQAGDAIVLAVDARDRNHACDLTEIDLRITQGERAWSLAGDVADTIAEGNPHGAWRFVHGPSRATPATEIPPDSLLGRWSRERTPELAAQLESLLTGPRPKDAKHPDRRLYDILVHVGGPLFRDVDLSKLPRRARTFGEGPDGLRLPAAIFLQHAWVVDAALDGRPGRAAQLRTSEGSVLEAGRPVLATPEGEARLRSGLAAFRALFPPFVCFPRVIPDDEVVCLKLYHREDEALRRLFLEDADAARLDRLWEDLDHISRWPVTEHRNLPLFIGFVTQDGGAEAVRYFESLREPFRGRAEAFERAVEASRPTHLDALLRFASQAWRRPLAAEDEKSLRALYGRLRAAGTAHDEAVRLTLVRVLTSPDFLFRVEENGPEPRALGSWEMASRLGYVLWGSTPDAELRRLAAGGRLQDDATLRSQVARMLKDSRARGLAEDFGAQWLHVQSLRTNRGKSESLFPMFDDALRDALFEEAVRSMEDLFRSGRPLEDLVDADATWLNETLAKHYGIAGVSGPHWRRVEGVRAHGRGGVLALGAVLAQQSGASRTSPVLRGNWVVETLLGEKLPKPPANVPQLPEAEGTDGLSVREMTLRHTRVPECASCHVRIDPFGFALEGFDAIGRRRDKAVDTRVELRDGTTFDGLDGLRAYLRSRIRDVRRTFTRKLLGYALGRSVTLSDQALLDSLDRDGLTAAEALAEIVVSPQFRRIRGYQD